MGAMSRDRAVGSTGLSLSLILQHAPVILFATDMDGCITFADGQGLQALGFQPQDMLGRRVIDVYAPWGDASGLMAPALAGHAVTGVYGWGDRHYHVHLQPLHSPAGHQVGLTGVAVDITPHALAARHTETLLQLSGMLDDAQARPTLRGTLCAALEALSACVPLDFLILWERQGAAYAASAWHGALPEVLHGFARHGVATAAVRRHVVTSAAAFWTGRAVPAPLRELGLAGVARLPLRGRPGGAPTVLCAYRMQPGVPWTAQERALLQAAVRSIAALQARRVHLQAMEDAALIDSLTRLPNRRAFEHDYPAALTRSRRQGVPLGLLITDIDGLKAVNDTHGHDRGDDLLRAFAVALRGALRDGERCYRLGGDEFAALLPAVAPEHIAVILTRLKRALDVLRHEGFPDVRASVGIAIFPDEASEAGAVLHLADQRMYQAKAARRLNERSGS